MKNTLIPIFQPYNLKLTRFMRNNVYHVRPRRSTSDRPLLPLPVKKKGVKVVFLIVAGSFGLLNRFHFDSLSRVLYRGLRHTRLGYRKNVANRTILYPRLFNLSITKKANGIRMGKGRGGVDRWVFPVRAGQVLYSIARGVNVHRLANLLLSLRYKLPITLGIISQSGSSLRYPVRGARKGFIRFHHDGL